MQNGKAAVAYMISERFEKQTEIGCPTQWRTFLYFFGGGESPGEHNGYIPKRSQMVTIFRALIFYFCSLTFWHYNITTESFI